MRIETLLAIRSQARVQGSFNGAPFFEAGRGLLRLLIRQWEPTTRASAEPSSNRSQNYHTIDGNRVPDGTYLFKIVASDAPTNTKEVALSDERISDAIEIDNTPPAIRVSGPSITGQTAEVVFDATDATSRIVRG